MKPLLKGSLSKVNEAPSPNELRLSLLDTNPTFQCLGEIAAIKLWPVQNTNIKLSYLQGEPIHCNVLLQPQVESDQPEHTVEIK